MDPTIKEPRKLGFKYKFKIWLEKIFKIIWYIIIIIIVIQGVLIVFKLFSKPPNERMCWDRWTCYDYCDMAKQKVCIAPEKRDTDTIEKSWRLLVTGKRNIIEILNDSQKYCACEVTVGEETRTETFFKFYSESDFK